MTQSVLVKLGYDDLMDAVEIVLAQKGLIKDTEVVVFTDLGLEVDERGNVDLEVEIDDIGEGPTAYLDEGVDEIDEDHEVVDIRDYRDED